MHAMFEAIVEDVHSARDGAERKRVLVFAGHYLPGYKSGGPIRSVVNMVSHLSPYFDFYVITRNRDATETQTYSGITPGQWYLVGSARVLYCSSVSAGVLRRVFREVRPDIILLNSIQDTFTLVTVLLRRVGVLGNTPVVLAPRGELSPGAMEIKPIKKRLYRQASKMLGFHEDLLWQATAHLEKLEILRAAPARQLDPDAIFVAHNITEGPGSNAPHPLKQAGAVKLVFISRISEKKNLHFILELLSNIHGKLRFNIFGPVAENDVAYWDKCKALLTKLPDNIEVEYRGPLDHSAVPETLRDHHFFVLPTRGENYCHAAVESFINGTPVILSDRTPWTGLREAYAGFDIPLNDPGGWVAAIQNCVDMDQQTYTASLNGAQEYSRRFGVEEAVSQHLAMFEAALAMRSGGRCRP
ncbi:MAG: glycosyltransferase family 4 protein [Terracidiphilus sp.]